VQAARRTTITFYCCIALAENSLRWRMENQNQKSYSPFAIGLLLALAALIGVAVLYANTTERGSAQAPQQRDQFSN
jgi:hypothetical protein